MSEPLAQALALFATEEQSRPEVLALCSGLNALAEAPDPGTRLDALVALAHWVAQPDGSLPWPAGEPDPAGGDPRFRRLGVLAALLERCTAAAEPLRTALEAVARDSQGLALYAEAGLPEHRGLGEEALDRLQRAVLPQVQDDRELVQVLDRLFPTPESARWLERIPARLLMRFLGAARVDPGCLAPQRTAVEEALCLLAARVDAVGLSRSMRDRRGREPVRTSPWYRITRSTEVLMQRIEAHALAPDDDSHETQFAVARALVTWRDDVAGCRAGNAQVLAHLEAQGVNAALVFAIESSGKILARMEHLLSVLLSPQGLERTAAAHRLLAELVRAHQADGSLRQLALDSSRVLARRVVERTAETGEKYIATGGRDYALMWLSALGGGAIAAVMATTKLALSRLATAPFVGGVLGSVNYTLGFVAMQLSLCTLATKQPAMTAASLASILRRKQGPERAEELSGYVARIVRSQLAAAFGNLAAVLVCGVLIAWAWSAASGRAFLSPAEAEYVLESVHPWRSLTAVYAFWTGIVLWMSSIAAGWVDNWFVYRRLPASLPQSPRLVRWLGAERASRWSAWLSERVSGLAGNLALGVLLGMSPVVGAFLGLPLDVRHVTLTSGKIALALSTLGQAAWTDPRLVGALGGIAVMFVMNLGVSFALALWVAARATGVAAADRRTLAAALLRRFVRSPLEFVWPMGESARARTG